MNEKFKIALVHDWLTGMRGGEKVLEALCDLFPAADVYTLFHVPGSVSPAIQKHYIKSSYLQKMPFIKEAYRYYLPLMPHAIGSFNLSEYDLVLSTSHCVAKGAKARKKGACHISYCFTPMRYIWDQFDNYFGEERANPYVRSAARVLRSVMQTWDRGSSERVHHFIADSEHVKRRIEKFYGRQSTVIYPPVNTDFYTPLEIEREDFYLIVSAFAPYKKINLAVRTFNALGTRLKIIGSGQDEAKLKEIALDNIEFLGWKSNEELRSNYRTCRALIFPGEEDFGIVPVEAMACGTPVIAYGAGGALETVINGKTGILFGKQTPQSLGEAIQMFESVTWQSGPIREQALKFSPQRFRKEITEFILQSVGKNAYRLMA